MTAAAIVFLAAALICCLCAIPSIVDRMRDKAWEAECPESPDADTEWLAVLAATDEPIFAEVWAESLRRDMDGWSA